MCNNYMYIYIYIYCIHTIYTVYVVSLGRRILSVLCHPHVLFPVDLYSSPKTSVVCVTQKHPHLP